MRATFWVSGFLLAWTQVLYGPALAVWRRLAGGPPTAPEAMQRDDELPHVSLVVAAYAEQEVIAAKVANALALDWPRDRLEIVVAVDGGDAPGADATACRAREAGADLVLELPRGGKVASQDAAVRAACAATSIVAFSDANALWERDALHALTAPFAADPRVGYVCGAVRFVNDAGDNQEGVYWRMELWIRAQESALGSVTAGNGAIYAVRRDAYVEVDPVMGHDLKLPFTLVKRGHRAVYAPAARATEKMVPTIAGEWARKRRMMSHAWPIVIRGGMLDPRGYPPRYALFVASHRVLRYFTPLLHAALALATLARAPRSAAARASLAAHVALAAAAFAGDRPAAPRPLLIARYYVLTTLALALGAADWLRHGTEAGWDAPEGTR